MRAIPDVSQSETLHFSTLFSEGYPTEQNQNKPEVAILLPTYCEAGNIESLIREIGSLDGNLFIIVIDDSSPDGTATIVEKLKEKYNIELFVRPNKLGLGTAITDGFRFILSIKNPPDHIITMDADYSHNPQDIPRLMQYARDGYDLVIGSRYCSGGKIVGWNSVRYLISRVANFVAAKMFETLAKHRINIMMISTSEIKISCIVASKYTELAVRVLHDAFELGEEKKSIQKRKKRKRNIKKR